MIPYTKEAYEAKKYAFVSDYARFWILYNYGGYYFDTDVEIVKSFEDIEDITYRCIQNGDAEIESVMKGNEIINFKQNKTN